MKKAQMFILVVFSLTFALFSLLTILVPIKDKLIRMKEMEYVYQAIANAEKGLEVANLHIFKLENFNLEIASSSVDNTNSCGGFYYQTSGTCIQIIYKPGESYWRSYEKFRVDSFIFRFRTDTELLSTFKTFSNGSFKNINRVIVFGSEK